MLEMLSSWQAMALAITAVVGVLYKTVKQLVLFNDDILKKRRAAYLSFLKTEASSNEPLSQLIDSLRVEESFQKIFARYASPKLATAMIELYETGHFSVREMRAASIYFHFDQDGRLTSKTGKGGVLIKALGSAFIIAMGILTFIILYGLALKPSISSLLASGAFLLVYFFFIWFFGKDVRAVVDADRIDRKISSLGAD
ncbi:MAG: hypothetical protein J0L89_07155 [Xanthomonadales bacterium]|nr:hypothetical protein [Xanthomonadales bacterium]